MLRLSVLDWLNNSIEWNTGQNCQGLNVYDD